jgi:hypothetical protein
VVSPAPLIALGFGKYVRADRIYALVPIEGDARGPGRRTLVHVEGIAEPLVASRSEAAIVADLGPGRATVPGELAVGPLARREIRAETRLDLDELERRGQALVDRAGPPPEPEALF